LDYKLYASEFVAENIALTGLEEFDALQSKPV
jgi:hypothetical protein